LTALEGVLNQVVCRLLEQGAPRLEPSCGNDACKGRVDSAKIVGRRKSVQSVLKPLSAFQDTDTAGVGEALRELQDWAKAASNVAVIIDPAKIFHPQGRPACMVSVYCVYVYIYI